VPFRPRQNSGDSLPCRDSELSALESEFDFCLFGDDLDKIYASASQVDDGELGTPGFRANAPIVMEKSKTHLRSLHDNRELPCTKRMPFQVGHSEDSVSFFGGSDSCEFFDDLENICTEQEEKFDEACSSSLPKQDDFFADNHSTATATNVPNCIDTEPGTNMGVPIIAMEQIYSPSLPKQDNFSADNRSTATATNVPSCADTEPGTSMGVPIVMEQCKLSPSAKPKSHGDSDSVGHHNGASAAPKSAQESDVGAKRRPNNRPFKSVREKRRRRDLKNTLMELHRVCQSAAKLKGQQISTTESVNATKKRKRRHKRMPNKVQILEDAVKSIAVLHNELTVLRIRNERLKTLQTSSQ